eukprot:Sspe_Gene.70584::Locus_41681_Transcript_1_1_Confidence_1.000_Length_1127::g.70584::m.70584
MKVPSSLDALSPALSCLLFSPAVFLFSSSPSSLFTSSLSASLSVVSLYSLTSFSPVTSVVLSFRSFTIFTSSPIIFFSSPISALLSLSACILSSLSLSQFTSILFSLSSCCSHPFFSSSISLLIPSHSFPSSLPSVVFSSAASVFVFPFSLSLSTPSPFSLVSLSSTTWCVTPLLPSPLVLCAHETVSPPLLPLSACPAALLSPRASVKSVLSPSVFRSLSVAPGLGNVFVPSGPAPLVFSSVFARVVEFATRLSTVVGGGTLVPVIAPFCAPVPFTATSVTQRVFPFTCRTCHVGVDFAVTRHVAVPPLTSSSRTTSAVSHPVSFKLCSTRSDAAVSG